MSAALPLLGEPAIVKYSRARPKAIFYQFVSFGLFSPRNATVITVLFVSACSMSFAVFLILELNRPLDGIIKVSVAPLHNVLEQLGQ